MMTVSEPTFSRLARSILSEVKLGLRERLSAALSLFVALALGGCAMWRDPLTIDYRSRAIRVQPMDRLSFDLEAAKGCEWIAVSDDLDVEVRLDAEADGVTYACHIRVFRGFDGPAHLRFRELDKRTFEEKRNFVLMLYKDVSDRAFWK